MPYDHRPEFDGRSYRCKRCGLRLVQVTTYRYGAVRTWWQHEARWAKENAR